MGMKFLFELWDRYRRAVVKVPVNCHFSEYSFSEVYA